MHPDASRSIALSLPDAAESEHAAHPGFRVGGKIFSTLGYPDSGSGMVKLPLELQEQYMRLQPKAFSPANGAWGRRGNTIVALELVDRAILREAIVDVWRHLAPGKLHARLQDLGWKDAR